MKLFEMSKDLRRFKTYPRRAVQLHAAPNKRVAFLGNSATERGLDLKAVQNDFRAQKIKVSTDLFVADASHLTTWQWMADRYFWTSNQAPDVLVVPYFGTSLEDRNTLEIGRLAQFFTTPRDAVAVMRQLPDAGSRIDFALSSVWATYAARTRLKERALSLLLPDYKEFEATLQRANQPKTRVPGKPTYRSLSRLIEQARAQRCRVVFVALPLRDNSYSIEPNLPTRVRSAGADFLDLHRLPAMKPTFYADSIHLNPQGRAVFTPFLTRALTPILEKLPIQKR